MPQYTDGLDADAYSHAAMQPHWDADGCVRWRLCKNCAMGPGQLARCLAWMSAPGLLVGMVFCVLGAPMILAFLVVQGTTLACCFVHYARHAADRELLTLSPAGIVVHKIEAGREWQAHFSLGAASLRLLPQQRNLVGISAHGRSVHVGTFVPQHLRPRLYQDLCEAARRFY